MRLEQTIYFKSDTHFGWDLFGWEPAALPSRFGAERLVVSGVVGCLTLRCDRCWGLHLQLMGHLDPTVSYIVPLVMGPGLV